MKPGSPPQLCEAGQRRWRTHDDRSWTHRLTGSASRGPSMELRVVDGDLLDQDIEVIVNAWNRNLIPWWLLLPQGVSAAIKRRGGIEPFRELGRMGMIPLGGAVVTGPGRLPF